MECSTINGGFVVGKVLSTPIQIHFLFTHLANVKFCLCVFFSCGIANKVLNSYGNVVFDYEKCFGINNASIQASVNIC